MNEILNQYSKILKNIKLKDLQTPLKNNKLIYLKEWIKNEISNNNFLLLHGRKKEIEYNIPSMNKAYQNVIDKINKIMEME